MSSFVQVFCSCYIPQGPSYFSCAVGTIHSSPFCGITNRSIRFPRTSSNLKTPIVKLPELLLQQNLRPAAKCRKYLRQCRLTSEKRLEYCFRCEGLIPQRSIMIRFAKPLLESMIVFLRFLESFRAASRRFLRTSGTNPSTEGVAFGSISANQLMSCTPNRKDTASES